MLLTLNACKDADEEETFKDEYDTGYKTEIYDIGSWDMMNDPTYDIFMPWNAISIISLSATINDDSRWFEYGLEQSGGFLYKKKFRKLILFRNDNGIFDSYNFSSTDIRRGHTEVKYRTGGVLME